MRAVTRALLAAALAFGSGCAQKDWIDRTLVTVDVTGVWTGRVGGQGGTGGPFGEFQFVLEQQGLKVKGFVRGNARSLGAQGPTVGSIEGTVAGDVFSFKDSRGNLAGEMTVSGDEMTGQASTFAGTHPLTLRRGDPSSPPASPPR
jgi:hypothetical protein